jgi:hypothetical protein
MWMLRLLPGMGPETKKPEPEARPGVQKIKLVPRAALPPQNANSKAIVSGYREQIAALYNLTHGRLEALHVMFCQIAEHNGKPPLPPQTMLALLELTPEDCKEQPVIVSEVQLEKAFEKMVKPDDNAENFITFATSSLRWARTRTVGRTLVVRALRFRQRTSAAVRWGP